MKLELDLRRRLLDVYTKFQIDIVKHVEKARKTEKSKTRKNNRQNSENKIFAKYGSYVEKYTADHICNKFKGFILLYEVMVAKNDFNLLLVIK